MGYASQGLGGPLVFSGPVRQLMPVYPAAGSTLTIVGGWENGSVLSPVSRTNLILQSQNFGTTWSKLAAGDTISTVSGPSADNANLLSASTSNAQHGFLQTMVVSSGTYTVSVFVKASGVRYVSLYPQTAGNAYAIFDLQNGVITATGAAQYIASSITNAGGGFWRCSVTLTAGAGNLNCVMYMVPSGTNPAPGFVGDGTAGVVFFGAQLETGSVASRYTATTTTAVSETDYSYDQSSGLITLTRALASDASWMTFGTVVTTPTATNTIYQASAASTV